MPQATSLTTLKLEFITRPPNTPTTSQLLSILASYPNLQYLLLHEATIPYDVSDGFTFRVPLRRLKKLQLSGDCHHVLRLLRLLECPDTMDLVGLNLSDCVVGEAISELLEPYVRNRIRRDRLQGRLGIHAWSTHCYTAFAVHVLNELDTPTVLPERGNPCTSFLVRFTGCIREGAGNQLCTNIIAAIPPERMVYFSGVLDVHAMRELFVAMPNIKYLCLTGSALFKMFPWLDPLPSTKPLPSLRYLCLDMYNLQNGDRRSLITYLAGQMSDGQAISLWLLWTHPPVPPEQTTE